MYDTAIYKKIKIPDDDCSVLLNKSGVCLLKGREVPTST